MEVRINKFLSEAGVCSRREADRQIEAGNVTIGGKPRDGGSGIGWTGGLFLWKTGTKRKRNDTDRD